MSFPQALFSTPTAFVRHGLDALERTVDLVMPLNGSRRRDLPDACRELSALLTTRRDGLDRPYWTSPRLTSAYLRYFLPWNLVRLTALLPGLPLDSPPPAETGKPMPAPDRDSDGAGEFLIFDLGSGPCTFPLALWLARPDLRRRPVTVVASDSAPHILDLGRRIFDALRAELDPDSPWTLRALRAPLQAAPRQLRGRPSLITLGNVLNELEERERRGAPLRETLDALLTDMACLLTPGGRLLVVEPGTRQGGRLTATLRDMALGCGISPEQDEDEASHGQTFAKNQDREGRFPRFSALAPCPHHVPCPMLTKGAKAWCHVRVPTAEWGNAAPAALTELSRAAGLSKDSVSLAFLLLERLGDNTRGSTRSASGARSPGRTREAPRLRARMVSDAFVLPGAPGRARYACTEQGLALIQDAAFLPPGALCEVCPTPRRDAKSGAPIMILHGSREHGRPEGHGKHEASPPERRTRRDALHGRLKEQRPPAERTERAKRHSKDQPATPGRADADSARPHSQDKSRKRHRQAGQGRRESQYRAGKR